MTVEEAWQAGRDAGIYTGGEGPEVKRELMKLCQRNQAHYHKGFWRVMHLPDARRAKRWADYWTAR